MVPDQPEREGRLHDQLLELESIRSAGLLTAAEHKSKREAVISRWEESQARLETTLAENKALLHALRATVKHGSDLLSKKQMAGVRQAYLELTGLSSLPSAVPKLSREGPSGTKRRAEDALDSDRETWRSLPDEPLDDLEDRGAPALAPATPGEVPPAPTEEEEPQEPEEEARRRGTEAMSNLTEISMSIIAKAKGHLEVEGKLSFRPNGPRLALYFDPIPPIGRSAQFAGSGSKRLSARQAERQELNKLLSRVREEERNRRKEEIEGRKRKIEELKRQRQAEREAERALKVQLKLEAKEKRELERQRMMQEKLELERELQELKRKREEERAKARIEKQLMREELKRKREEELQERKRLRAIERMKAAEERAQAKLDQKRRKQLVPKLSQAGPSGTKRRAEDALDSDRETWGSWSLPGLATPGCSRAEPVQLGERVQRDLPACTRVEAKAREKASMVDLPGFKGMSFSSEYWGTGFTRRKLRAIWITVVVLSVGALLPLAIYLFYQDHTSAREVILVLGSIFTFLAVPTTMYGIWQHVSNYTQPLLQRYIIRILWMVPIYALDSWVVLILTKACLAKYSYVPDMITLSYEAYTVYNFFEYLIKYLEISSGQTAGELLQSKHFQSPSGAGEVKTVVEHLPPFRLKWGDRIDFKVLDPWPVGEVFVSRCKWGVMSYILFSPLYLIVSISYESVHQDVAEKRMFQFSSVLFYFTLAQSAISVWAVYCLVLFYHEARNELRPIKPLAKFLSIKGIVFVTFWQSIMLQFLGNLWINEKGDIYDKKHGLWDCPYSKFHVTQALNCFLLTIEMFILSFAFAFSFPSSEFKIPIDATGFMLDDEDGGDVTVLPRNSLRPKLRALFDIGDVQDDVMRHTAAIGTEIGHEVSFGFKQIWRRTLMFTRRLFGYDSYHYGYLLQNNRSGKSYQSTAYTAPEVPAGKYDNLDDVLTPIKR